MLVGCRFATRSKSTSKSKSKNYTYSFYVYLDLIKNQTHTLGLIVELDFMGLHRPKPILKRNLRGLNFL